MTEWDPDLARAKSLIRDEGRLRNAYAAAASRRFDVATYAALRYRVEDLLETVSAVAEDTNFWERLESGQHPPTEQQLARVVELDTAAFACLLEAAGYVSPPKPTAEELVDDTVAALARAAKSNQAAAAQAREQARLYLRTMVWRVRRDIDPAGPAELASSMLRSSARGLGATARWLIPTAVAVAAGSIVEAHAPGTGAGIALGKAVERVAEKATALAADILVRGQPDPQPEAGFHEQEYAATPNPITVHLTALYDQTDVISKLVEAAGGDRPEDVRRLLPIVRRHLDRLEELIADLGYRHVTNDSAALADLRGALDRLGANTTNARETRRQDARLCVDAATFLRGELNIG